MNKINGFYVGFDIILFSRKFAKETYFFNEKNFHAKSGKTISNNVEGVIRKCSQWKPQFNSFYLRFGPYMGPSSGLECQSVS